MSSFDSSPQLKILCATHKRTLESSTGYWASGNRSQRAEIGVVEEGPGQWGQPMVAIHQWNEMLSQRTQYHDPPFHLWSRSRGAGILKDFASMEPHFGAMFGYVSGIRSQGYVKVVGITKNKVASNSNHLNCRRIHRSGGNRLAFHQCGEWRGVCISFVGFQSG